MTDLSFLTAGKFREAGWEPSRAYNCWLARRRLEIAGYTVHERASKFLSEFGGITASAVDYVRRFQNSRLVCFGNFRAMLTPRRCNSSVKRADCYFLRRAFGVSVCYVGYIIETDFADPGCLEATLYSASDGRFLICNTRWYGLLICPSFKEAADAILLRDDSESEFVPLESAEHCQMLEECGILSDDETC